MTGGTAPFATRTFTDLGDPALASAWSRLEAVATRIDPFTTRWWAGGAPARGKAEPLVVVAYRGEEPVALAALALEPAGQRGRLVPLAPAHRDFVDVLVADGADDAVRALCDSLPWDRISGVALRGIPEDSPLGPALLEAARRHGLKGAMGVDGGAPELSFVDEGGTRHTDFRGIMRGKRNRQLKTRLAKAGTPRFVRATEAAQAPGMMASLFWLYQKRWAAAGDPAMLAVADAEDRRRLVQVAEGALAAGRLHLAILYLDDQPLAAALGYLIGKTYYYHLVAVDLDRSELSPLRTFLAYLYDDLLAHTPTETFNYLLGEEAYKLDHATRSRVLLRLRMTRAPARAAAVRLAAAAEAWLRRRPRLMAVPGAVWRAYRRRRFGLACTRARLRHQWRSLGPRKFLARAVGKAGHWILGTRAMIVLGRELPPDAPAAPEPAGLAVRPGTLEDFNALIPARFGFWDPRALAGYFANIRSGMRHYVACLDGRVAGSLWVMPGGRYAPGELYEAMAVTVDPARDVFLIDVWTAPEFRGRGVYPALCREVLRRLHAEGFCERARAAVDTRNLASLQAHAHLGFVPVEELRVVRLFGRVVRTQRRALGSPPAPPAPPAPRATPAPAPPASARRQPESAIDIEQFNQWLRVTSRQVRKFGQEWRARLTGKRFYCAALSGESDYNICVNCDMTVSCNCKDMDGAGQIGSLAHGSLADVFASPKATGFRRTLAAGRLPILTCASCSELRIDRREEARRRIDEYDVPQRGLMVENTISCCFRCVSCSRQLVSRRRRKQAMSLDDMRQVAAQVRRYGIEYVAFFNLGEPFCAAQVYEQMQILRTTNPATRITIATNGMLLDTDPKREAALLADAVIFSIDGVDDATTNRYQRGSRFERCYGNMKRLVEFRSARGRTSPIIEWKYILFNWNDREVFVRRAIELAEAARVDVLSFWPTYTPVYGISWRYHVKRFYRTLGVSTESGRAIFFARSPQAAPRVIPAPPATSAGDV